MGDDLFDQIEEAIIEVRDAHPRRPDDASSADVALAVLKVVNAHEKAVRERIAQDILADRTDAPWEMSRQDAAVGHWLDSRDATKAARIAREGA